MYSQASNSHYDSRERMLPMTPTSAGGWALLALHERPKTSDGTAVIRYAFISEKSPREFEVVDARSFLSLSAEAQEIDALLSGWQQALSGLHHSMTTLKKAPETDAATPAEMIAAQGRGSDDALSPKTCKDVSFGACDHEEVVEALEAVKVLNEKPPNQFQANLPAGSSCQQN